MFNPTRLSRLLTVPSLLVAAVVMLLGAHPVWALVVFPPAAALPWLVIAAAKGTHRAIRNGLIAVRAVAYLLGAWGLLALMFSLLGGGVVLGAGLLLLAAAGTRTQEPRLAVSVLVLGAMTAVVAVPMMWVGIEFWLLCPTGIAMAIGGLWWLLESLAQPLTEHPELPFAIATLPRDATVAPLPLAA